MISVSVSPGDPIFWLHHTYLDKLFWDWQSQNLTTRLTEIGGSNLQDLSAGEGSLPGGGKGDLIGQTGDPDPRFVDYFNDGGNITTLNHTLWSAGIAANATIADVMDARGDYVCAEYSWVYSCVRVLDSLLKEKCLCLFLFVGKLKIKFTPKSYLFYFLQAVFLSERVI